MDNDVAKSVPNLSKMVPFSRKGGGGTTTFSSIHSSIVRGCELYSELSLCPVVEVTASSLIDDVNHTCDAIGLSMTPKLFAIARTRTLIV